MSENTAESIPFEEIKTSVHVTRPQDAQSAEIMTPETIARNEIKKFNIADAAIEQMKREYGGLKIQGIEDRDAYKKVHAAWQIVRGKRLQVEKAHKIIKADYLHVSRAIDGEKNRLLGLIEPLENELNAELERIDRLKKEESEKAERMAQERLQGRVNALIENGVSFNGSFYAIGETISIDVVTLKNLTDNDFTSLLQRVQLEYSKITEAREAEAQRIRDEAEAFQRQKEENERQAAELKRQSEDMERQRAEMKLNRTQLRTQILINAGFEVTHLGTLLFQTKDAGYCEVNSSDFADLSADQWDSKFLELRADVNRLRTLQADTEQQQREKQAQAEREAQLKKELEARTASRIKELYSLFPQLKTDTAGNYFQEFKTEGGPEYFQVILSGIKSATDEDWEEIKGAAVRSFADYASREAENLRAIEVKKEAERMAAMSDIERLKHYFDQIAAIRAPAIDDSRIAAAFKLYDGTVANAHDTLFKTLELISRK